jgi:hypothetical protein
VALKRGCIEPNGLVKPLQKNVPFFMPGPVLALSADRLFLAVNVLCIAVARIS